MSEPHRWNHTMCRACWCDTRLGEPVRFVTGESKVCCFCGATATDGIYVRHNPEGMKCALSPEVPNG